MDNKERKYLFDANVFDAPPPAEAAPDAPPPPPVFSETELAAARDMAFEQGRQQGRREETESRDQLVAATLGTVADGLSHLLAAEAVRETVFEREALRLSVHALDLLFPRLNQALGRSEVMAVLEKTLSDHRKAKEIVITVPQGLRADVDAVLARLRDQDTDTAPWRVTEDASLASGDCRIEWSDGGAVRDSLRCATDIRDGVERLIGEKIPPFACADDGHGIRAEPVVSFEKPPESDGKDGEPTA